MQKRNRLHRSLIQDPAESAENRHVRGPHSLNGNQRIDWPTADGIVYYVEVVGDNVDFYVRFANLLHHDASNSSVTVHGTDIDGDMDIFGGQCHYSHRDPGESDPPDVFWIESVSSGVSGRVTWVKHQLSTKLKMGRYPSIADLDGDGDMDLAMRPIGFGGYRELNPKGQYDVTIFRCQSPGGVCDR